MEQEEEDKERMAYQSGKEIHLNQNNQGLHYSRVEEDQLPETLRTQ